MSNNTISFSLELYQTGDYDAVSDGEVVKQLHWFKSAKGFALVGVRDAMLETFTKDGKYDLGLNASAMDLQLRPKQIIAYANVYKLTVSKLHDSIASADFCLLPDSIGRLRLALSHDRSKLLSVELINQ